MDFHPIWVTTEHWVEVPVLHSRFSLVICFTHCSVYRSMQFSSSSHPLTWVLEWIGVIKRKGRRRCFRQMILCEQRHGSVPWGFVVRICTYWSIRLCERLVHGESVQVGTGCIIIVSTIRNLDFVLLVRESQWASSSFEEGDSADRVS